MISPNDFANAWGMEEDDESRLIRFKPAMLEGLPIGDEDRAFLVEAGLPDSAAPFLSFEPPRTGRLRAVATVYDLDDEFAGYFIIGTDGSGDPICIDTTAAGSIVALNHDNEFEEIFMNSSIPCLAESLLAFRELIKRTQAAGEKDAYFEQRVPDDAKQWWWREMERIDPPAMAPDCFWRIEYEGLQPAATKTLLSMAKQLLFKGRQAAPR